MGINAGCHESKAGAMRFLLHVGSDLRAISRVVARFASPEIRTCAQHCSSAGGQNAQSRFADIAPWQHMDRSSS